MRLPVNDKPVWNLFFSQFHLAVVSVADEIGLLLAIGDGITEEKKLASHVSLSLRGLESLSLSLKAVGLLNNLYSLSEVGKTYFIPTSPYYWGAILTAYRKSDVHKRILDGLRNQRNLEISGQSLTMMWKSGEISAEAAKSFTARMDCMSATPAAYAVKTDAFHGVKTLLDIGGGSGVFSRAFLDQHPDAQAIVFDLPPVIQEAKQYQRDFSSKQNIHYISGSFFETWPTQQQAILLANILHDWPLPEGRLILEKAYESLQIGGRLIIHEMLFEDEDLSNIGTSFFDLLMCINHGAQQYKKHQLIELLNDLGFRKIKQCAGSAFYTLIYAEKE